MIFYYFDFISPDIQLYYKGRKKHSSIYSILISIITFITLLILSIIFSLDFFYIKIQLPFIIINL